MKEIVVSDEWKDFLNKENEPLKELAKEYDTYINNAKDKEIERLNNIINELEKWLEEEKEATLFDYNFAIEDVLDKLKELKNCTKESQNDAIKSNDEAIKRINKALAYIKENAWYDYRDNEEVITISKEKLLEILQGSDKE